MTIKCIYLISAIVMSLSLSSCSKQGATNGEAQTANTAAAQNIPTPGLSPVPPTDANYPGRGEITKINMQLGSVELDHEEITGVMPPMIMEFYVKDKSLLKGLNVGDNVDFVLEYKHPAETIVSITKRK